MDKLLLDPDAAAGRLLEAAPPLGEERVDISRALGRTLAEEILSPIALPPFDRSAMDGYAVRFESPWPVLPVSGVARAGHQPDPLKPGTAVRIFTGAPIPEGADTVIEQEACRVDGGVLHIDMAGFQGRNVMKRGHEVAWRASVARPGTRLSPYHVSLLASLGIARVAVRARPRVAILQTGDELEWTGRSLAPAHIYASNGTLLAALVEEWGGQVVASRRVGDSLPAVESALRRAAEEASLVVVSGGVSVGDFDFMPEALKGCGQRLFWGVSMHPGRAMAGGLVEGTPVAALSGNPGAVVLSWLRVVNRFWAAWHGGVPVERWTRTRLQDGYAKASRETRYVPVRVGNETAAADLPRGADVVTAFVQADGFAVLPAGSPPVAPGASVSLWEPGGVGGRVPRWSGDLR
ncbi:MAG: molybdopterin molybdotransferase MoeA [Clostridia bacterium]